MTVSNIVTLNVNDDIKEWKLKSILFNQIHDSILIDLFPGESEKLKNICEKVIKYNVQEYSNVPLTMSFQEGKRWGQ